MHQPGGFRFVDSFVPADEPAAHVVRIAAGVRRQRQLLVQYDRVLTLPDYFGWNWDALEECLGDLSWLDPPRRVSIVHADLPFAPRGKNRGQYLALLGDVVKANQAVMAIFPRAVEAEIARVVSNLAGDA